MSHLFDHAAAMRRVTTARYARTLITRMQLRLDHIRALVPWPALHDALQRELDECRRIGEQRGMLP